MSDVTWQIGTISMMICPQSITRKITVRYDSSHFFPSFPISSGFVFVHVVARITRHVRSPPFADAVGQEVSFRLHQHTRCMSTHAWHVDTPDGSHRSSGLVGQDFRPNLFLVKFRDRVEFWKNYFACQSPLKKLSVSCVGGDKCRDKRCRFRLCVIECG